MFATPKSRNRKRNCPLDGQRERKRSRTKRKSSLFASSLQSVKGPSSNFEKDVCNSEVLKDFVIQLDSVDDLAKKYRGTYKLDLRGFNNGVKLCSSHNRCANTKELENILLGWQAELNRKSKHEPILKVENFVDDCLPPTNFEYIVESIASCDISEMFNENLCVGCECKRCTPKGCQCALTDGSTMAYDKAKRIVIEPGLPVFECKKTCKCSKACPNRVVQQGRTVKVLIFRTPDGRGWGVKTLEFIPKNQFVLEYVGEIITNDEAERRGKFYDAAQQTYLFDLDFDSTEASYAIDAYHFGNVSHFINHSCDPNLRVYGVYVDCIDARLPRLAFFARRDISIGEELTFDYQSSHDPQTGGSPMTPSKFRQSPTLKKFLCACGAKNCRKYLF